MKTKLATSVLASILIFIAAFEIKSQCSCSYVTPDSSYVDVVFVGKILSISEENKSNKYEIQISEIFKGLNNQETIEVFDSFYNCNDRRQIDKEYLFMVSRDKETRKLDVVGCSYSYENKHQQRQMIEVLRWKKNSQNQGGILVGKVINGFDNEGNSRKPVEINQVFLENTQGDKFEAIIENDGFYKFTNLKDGNYKLYLELPETLTTYGDANGFDWESSIRPNINISGKEGRIQDFRILTNGIISGKITDENNLPVSSIDVNLYRLDENGKDSTAGMEKTDFQGNYSFKGLIPGKFYIKVGAKDWFLQPDEKNAEFPLTYFPNVLNRVNAEIINLKQAQILNNKNIFLTKLKTRTIKGRVVMEDGSPAKNAGIEIDIKRENDGQKLRGGNLVVTKTDANGEFSIDLFENTDYLISADITERIDDVQVKVLFSSKCIVIPKNGGVKPLKITLKKGSENCDEDKFGF